MYEKIFDVTGAELAPGDPEHCQGNGEHPDFECCCDECDYLQICTAGSKIIFLDVDGVLNCRSSVARCGHALGVDEDKVKRLKRIVDATGAEIVLVSTWKDYWEREHKGRQDELANYLDCELQKQGITIIDKTTDNYRDRGVGILNWLDLNPTKAFVIIDDERFDYDSFDVLAARLVETTEGRDDGGLQDWHVERAIDLLG